MRYVTLKPNMVLRGWKDIPYGILDLDNREDHGKVHIIDEAQFEALCLVVSPGVSIDDSLLPPKVRALAEKGLKEGYLEECSKEQGLEDYQKFRKTEARYIHTLLWSITGKCNLRCRHCYVSALNNPYGEITWEQCEDVVQQLLEANVHMVALTGGEPLVRKDFWKLVDLLLEKRIRVLQIFTNGMSVNDSFMDEFDKRNINPNCFLISFDGIGCHDWIRGVDGAELRTIEAIKLIKNRGYAVVVSTALHMGNIHALIPTYELMKTLGVDVWKAVPIVDAGNWKKQEQEPISYQVIFDEYLKLLERYKRDEMPLRLKLGGFFNGKKHKLEYTIPFIKKCESCKRDEEYLCKSAIHFPYLLADGRVLPCIAMSGSVVEDTAPSIFEEGNTLASILGNPKWERATYKDLFIKNSECGNCEYRFRCTGCRANALADGDYYGKDRLACAFFKGNYEQQINQIMQR